MILHEKETPVLTVVAENILIFPKWSQNSSPLHLVYQVLRIMKNVGCFISCKTQYTPWALFNLVDPALQSFGSWVMLLFWPLQTLRDDLLLSAGKILLLTVKLNCFGFDYK